MLTCLAPFVSLLVSCLFLFFIAPLAFIVTLFWSIWDWSSVFVSLYMKPILCGGVWAVEWTVECLNAHLLTPGRRRPERINRRRREERFVCAVVVSVYMCYDRFHDICEGLQ